MSQTLRHRKRGRRLAFILAVVLGLAMFVLIDRVTSKTYTWTDPVTGCTFQNMYTKGSLADISRVFVGGKYMHRQNSGMFWAIDLLKKTRSPFATGSIVRNFIFYDSFGSGYAVIVEGKGVCRGWYMSWLHLPDPPSDRFTIGEKLDPDVIIGEPGCTFEFFGCSKDMPAHNHTSLFYCGQKRLDGVYEAGRTVGAVNEASCQFVDPMAYEPVETRNDGGQAPVEDVPTPTLAPTQVPATATIEAPEPPADTPAPATATAEVTEPPADTPVPQDTATQVEATEPPQAELPTLPAEPTQGNEAPQSTKEAGLVLPTPKLPPSFGGGSTDAGGAVQTPVSPVDPDFAKAKPIGTPSVWTAADDVRYEEPVKFAGLGIGIAGSLLMLMVGIMLKRTNYWRFALVGLSILAVLFASIDQPVLYRQRAFAAPQQVDIPPDIIVVLADMTEADFGGAATPMPPGVPTAPAGEATAIIPTAGLPPTYPPQPTDEVSPPIVVPPQPTNPPPVTQQPVIMPTDTAAPDVPATAVFPSAVPPTGTPLPVVPTDLPLPQPTPAPTQTPATGPETVSVLALGSWLQSHGLMSVSIACPANLNDVVDFGSVRVDFSRVEGLQYYQRGHCADRFTLSLEALSTAFPFKGQDGLTVWGQPMSDWDNKKSGPSKGNVPPYSGDVPSPNGCTELANFPYSVSRWCGYMTDYGGQFGVEPALIAAVTFQESGGNPTAYSKSGAVGLMQVMPRDGIAAGFVCGNGPCFKDRPSMEQLYVPDFNIKYGTKMLSQLINKYGSVREALKYYGPRDVGYYYADIVLKLYRQYR